MTEPATTMPGPMRTSSPARPRGRTLLLSSGEAMSLRRRLLARSAGNGHQDHDAKALAGRLRHASHGFASGRATQLPLPREEVGAIDVAIAVGVSLRVRRARHGAEAVVPRGQ